MDKYHLWLDSLEKEGNYPWTLEESRGVRLFKLSKPYMFNHNCYNQVTYHVWADDVWLYAGRDYNEAYNIYRHEINNILFCEVE